MFEVKNEAELKMCGLFAGEDRPDVEHLIAADKQAETKINIASSGGSEVGQPHAALAEHYQHASLLGLHEIGDLPVEQQNQNTRH
jgi:hypothetical protein